MKQTITRESEMQKLSEKVTKEGVAYYAEITSYNDFIPDGQRFMVSLYSPSGDWMEAKDYKSLSRARSQAGRYLDLVTH